MLISRKFEGLKKGEIDRLTTSVNGTGIPHYNNVRLSHLLTLFQTLGFERVVVFDEGCRTGDMFVSSGRGEQETAAAEEEGTLTGRTIDPNVIRGEKRGDYGGRRTRRTKRTRRRSRRFHKKS